MHQRKTNSILNTNTTTKNKTRLYLPVLFQLEIDFICQTKQCLSKKDETINKNKKLNFQVLQTIHVLHVVVLDQLFKKI